ncbi:hypothetical protein KQI84_09675 [bacterium]|nr:hypothetical protein [bacterium]
MRKGFTKTTLGVLAAALVSGSVFAVGPTVDEIPTVFMTDKMTSDTFDFNTDTTQNLFRFSDAFELASYVSDADSPASELKYLFTESTVASPSTPLTGGAQTISIDGNLGYATLPPTTADILLDGYNVDTGDALDFRNVQYSPEPNATPYADPGSINDEAIITMFVTDQEESGLGFKSFSVITTNDGTLDRLSESTGVFTPVDCYDTFDGWIFAGASTFLTAGYQLPTVSGDANDLTQSPATSPAPAATASVTAGTGNGGQVDGTNLLADWALPSGNLTLTQGNLYMFRWTIAGDNAPGNELNNATLRVRVGPNSTDGIGQAHESWVEGQFNNSGPNTTPRAFRQYAYAHATGDAQLFFDVYDFTPTVALDATLSQVEIFTVDTNGLTGETMVYNAGNPAMVAASGQPTPAASPTTFDIGGVWRFQNINPTRSITTTGSGTTALIQNLNGTGTAMTYGTWISDGDGLQNFLSVGNDKLLWVDIWMSAPTPSVDLPELRLGVNGSQTDVGGAGAGRTSHFNFRSDNAASVLNSLETSSKRFSIVMEPQMLTGSTWLGNITFDVFAFQPFLSGVNDSGITRIDQVTVRTFDSPAAPASACP